MRIRRQGERDAATKKKNIEKMVSLKHVQYCIINKIIVSSHPNSLVTFSGVRSQFSLVDRSFWRIDNQVDRRSW
jgi:hypothetical protein